MASAMGRLSTWASAASDLLLGERTERTAPTRPRPVLPTDLAERISQAGRQVLEADPESQAIVPRSARLRVREVQTPRQLPALPAGLKTRTRRVQAWNFDGEVSTIAESSGKEMSLVSILHRQHQALPEWEGTPEVKVPRRKVRNRNETSGPVRLSGGHAVPKMNVRQFLELLKNPGRIDTDLQPRQKYVFMEDLVPARSHVSLVRSIGSEDRKEVVVKTLRKGCFVSLEEEEQWFRSNSELQMLEPHENLCQILDLWKDWKDNSYHLVMELVPGMDLFTLLQQQGPLGPQIASQITKDVLQGLAVLHRRKLVHRDIKLQNIMAQPCHGMKAKILDFDTVRPVEGSDPSFVVGSDQYIAPEAYEAGYSPASDLFSVGVVCFALCFGRFPFSCKIFDDQPGENSVGSPKMLEIARRLRSAQISWPENHQETKDFCRWLLDMTPKSRPSDASEALTHPFLRG